ncbi:MAG: (2Fe-2S)-binding protein [Peptococcaceae bacterium]|nr:(2Fe-2S)-binding protein [Peptococcaceae bacterium]
MEVKINGIPYLADEGEFVLNVARRNHVAIPTLCHHDGLPGQGCCRLCLVEAVERGRSRVVTACVFPVAEGLEVLTDTDRVAAVRRRNLALLRLRAPEADRVKQLCSYYKVAEDGRFEAMDGERCILCGLCVRACASLGTGAISAINRGVTKKIAPPYEEAPESCIGCGSCAEVCPTKAIQVEQTRDTRVIWDRAFAMQNCSACGEPYTTVEAAHHAARATGQDEAAHHTARATGQDEAAHHTARATRQDEAIHHTARATSQHEALLCPACRAKRVGEVMRSVYGR